jgi:hypothetical protein
VDEFHVRGLGRTRGATASVELVVPDVDADDGPAWLAPRDQLRERAVSATRVEDMQRAAGGELVERLRDELAAQPSGRGEQPRAALERAPGIRPRRQLTSR